MVKKVEKEIEIKPLDIQRYTIKVVGDTPMIMHKWSEKAKRMMLEAQQGTAKGKKKESKNPVEDFISSMYWITEEPTEFTEEAFSEAIANGARFGFPLTAFKQSAISAAYRMGWVKDKMSLRGAFFIEADAVSTDGSEVVEIFSDPPTIREDMVRVGMGTADIRYRGEFRQWYANLTISYNANAQYSLENILNILNAGGYVCGVGEWRPEKDGQNGMFHIAQ